MAKDWQNVFASARIAGLMVLMIVAYGCVVPRPYSAMDITRIEDKEIQFIEPGATTRDEILAKLGPPDKNLDENARWLFILNTYIDGGVQWCGGDVSACTDKSKDRTDTYLDVAFDDAGVVHGARIVSAENRKIPDRAEEQD